MFRIMMNPRSIYNGWASKSPWKWVGYFLIANVSLLALASTLVGMVLYGKIFALSLVLWGVVWLLIIILVWFISGLIGNYLLQAAGKKVSLTETFLVYGLACGANVLGIIIYTILDLLVEVLPGAKVLIFLVIVWSLGRYLSTVAYGLSLRCNLTFHLAFLVAVLSFLPTVCFIFLF